MPRWLRFYLCRFPHQGTDGPPLQNPVDVERFLRPNKAWPSTRSPGSQHCSLFPSAASPLAQFRDVLGGKGGEITNPHGRYQHAWEGGTIQPRLTRLAKGPCKNFILFFYSLSPYPSHTGFDRFPHAAGMRLSTGPDMQATSSPPRLGTNLCRFRQPTLRDRHTRAITGT
ncbi:hypothetical protein F5X98DRAFT_331000 [Xylaria grammica]|nr:hypothetical protein F5X98DRAFT_331000 [Xylaria grammica]